MVLVHCFLNYQNLVNVMESHIFLGGIQKVQILQTVLLTGQKLCYISITKSFSFLIKVHNHRSHQHLTHSMKLPKTLFHFTIVLHMLSNPTAWLFTDLYQLKVGLFSDLYYPQSTKVCGRKCLSTHSTKLCSKQSWNDYPLCLHMLNGKTSSDEYIYCTVVRLFCSSWTSLKRGRSLQFESRTGWKFIVAGEKNLPLKIFWM